MTYAVKTVQNLFTRCGHERYCIYNNTPTSRHRHRKKCVYTYHSYINCDDYQKN